MLRLLPPTLLHTLSLYQLLMYSETFTASRSLLEGCVHLGGCFHHASSPRGGASANGTLRHSLPTLPSLLLWGQDFWGRVRKALLPPSQPPCPQVHALCSLCRKAPVLKAGWGCTAVLVTQGGSPSKPGRANQPFHFRSNAMSSEQPRGASLLPTCQSVSCALFLKENNMATGSLELPSDS